MSTNFATVENYEEVIKAAPTAELLEFYNRHAEKPIKKFESHAAAVSRVIKMVGSMPPAEELKGEEKKPTTKSPGKREGYEHRTIKLLATENKKKVGSRAHKKFEILMAHDGKTIKEFKEREGKYPTLDDEAGWPATELRWALKLNLAKVVNGEG